MSGGGVILLVKRLAGAVLFTFLCVAQALAAQTHERRINGASDDNLFVALREASRRGDVVKATEWAAQLSHYEIPSYVEYYRLKPKLQKLPDGVIREFLNRYEGTAIADRLRNDWLLELGRAGNWAMFDEQYPQFVLDDDLQVKCYALTSRVLKGKNGAEEARTLLNSPKDYGDGCQGLVATLVRTRQWSDEDVWSQIRLAAELGYSGVARRMAHWVGAFDRDVVAAIDKPVTVLGQAVGSSPAQHQIYLIALGRWAKTNLEQADQLFRKKETYFTTQEITLGWGQIALQAAIKLVPDALDYWRRAEGASLSLEGYQWRVRSALRAGDWKQVRQGIATMPASLRDDPVWAYWLGRSLKEAGQRDEAQKLFQSIAGQPHFYGQLAEEELGGKVMTYPVDRGLSQAEMATMASYPGFRRALKLFELGLRFEGIREWNWELRKMNDRQYLAAAEFARSNNVLDRMVSTSERTKNEVDFAQRFPVPFYDVMHQTTTKLGLDMAWVYGLIRQESRFVMSAQSYVGAAGLMQVMPATAKFVAKKIGMLDFTSEKLQRTDMNIMLGSHYLSMMLKDLGGSQLMASAAYNAGPARLRTWRATLSHSVEGAIFAESIPFSETRAYVKNVLLNATYYAALFEHKPQSLKLRLGVVTPKIMGGEAITLN